MSFKDIYLFEREDSNILSKVTPVAEKLMKDTISEFKKLFDEVFIKSKSKDDFKKFDKVFPDFEVGSLRFDTKEEDGTAYYSYKDGYIYITEKTIFKALKMLNSIVEALKETDEPNLIKAFKDKAKESYTQFLNFFPSLKSVLVHELVHKYDDEVNKIFSSKYYQKIKEYIEEISKQYKLRHITKKEYNKALQDSIPSNESYYNRDAEVNAYFLQSLYSFLDEYQKRTKISDQWKDNMLSYTFQEFKDFFVERYISYQYSYWNEVNKRKFIKRLYDFYTKFLQKLKEEDQ